MSENKTQQAPMPPMGGGRGMRGGPGMGGTGEKAKNFSQTMKKFISFIKPYALQLIGVIIFAVASCIFTILGPKIVGDAINVISDGFFGRLQGGSGIDYDALMQIIMTLLGLYAASALCSFMQNFVVSGVSANLSYSFREQISAKINRLPLQFFDKQSHGDILSRITNDVDTVNQSLNQSLSQIITSTTTVVGVLVMMLTISPIMTLIALAVIPIAPLFITRVVKYSQTFFRKQQQYLGLVNGQVEEVYSGHMIVKSFGAEEDAVKKYNEYNDELYKTAWKSQFLSGLMQPVMNFLSNLAYVAVCVVGGFLAMKGSLQIGSISAFMSYMRNFTQPISQLAQISNVLQSTAAAAERVFDFLEQPEESDDSQKADIADTIKGDVVFEHVSFGYSPETKVIHDFSAAVKAGQNIAIVGPTGAGKTTIVKLLMRFYELNDGAIYIDGANIAGLKRGGLRSVFGMVLQDTWLYGGTVRDNIRFGKRTASDEDVINAAKAANVHRFIKTLPGGYDYVIDEESGNISGGQKQLLTIARAFLANPKVLILDEATSSVDTRTELVIQKAMKDLMKDKTSFVIAHRLSTIRDADLILVMNKGDIVEQGTHNELLAMGGFYSDLYNAQFENGNGVRPAEQGGEMEEALV